MIRTTTGLQLDTLHDQLLPFLSGSASAAACLLVSQAPPHTLYPSGEQATICGSSSERTRRHARLPAIRLHLSLLFTGLPPSPSPSGSGANIQRPIVWPLPSSPSPIVLTPASWRQWCYHDAFFVWQIPAREPLCRFSAQEAPVGWMPHSRRDIGGISSKSSRPSAIDKSRTDHDEDVWLAFGNPVYIPAMDC